MATGQKALTFSMRQHNVTFWKGATGSDNTTASEDLTFTQPEFSALSLSRPGQPQACAVQITTFKVYPYDFLDPSVPSTFSLTASEENESTSVPQQSYITLADVNGRNLLWYAVSIRVRDLNGDPYEVNLTTDADASFNILPRIKAHSVHLDEASIDVWNSYAFTCFYVNLETKESAGQWAYNQVHRNFNKGPDCV
eukprot:5177024-Amphidinium_carterae.1